MADRTATGTFSGSGQSAAVGALANAIDISISGTFVATVTLQRSHDGGTTWNAVEAFTEATEKQVSTASSAFIYRLSCVYTSGSVVYFIGSSRLIYRN